MIDQRSGERRPRRREKIRRLAGVTLIAGSLLFFISATQPVVSDYFRTDESLLRLRYIEEDPAAWDLAMVMLGAGGFIAAIGLVPLARSVQQVTDRRILGVLAYGAATLAIGGAVSWVIISYFRVIRPPFEVVFVDASPWLFGSYRVLTRTAVVIIGVVLLLSGNPRWLGWMLIVAGALMFADLVPQVLPPFAHYVVFLILGVGLLVQRPRPRSGSLGTRREGEPVP
jgi:hypothetical protein